MTRERIEEIQEVIVPYFIHKLKKLNYEGLGEADAEEAEKDLNEIFSLAIKALEQGPTTKSNLEVEKAIEIIKSDNLAPYSVNEILAARDLAVEALEQMATTKNDLGVDWESYKDTDGNSLDYLILNVLQNNFDCGDAYGYIVADKIIGLLPSVTPQEPFMATPCISSKVCEHDKVVTLDKIRAEIEELDRYFDNDYFSTNNCPMYKCNEVLMIIDKNKKESEE